MGVCGILIIDFIKELKKLEQRIRAMVSLEYNSDIAS